MFVKIDENKKQKILKREAVFPYRAKFQITNYCNAKCKHCNLWRKRPIFINKEIVLKAIEELKELGCEEIDFTGGEATLHPSLLQFIDKVYSLGIKPRLNTNGFNVTEELAKKLVLAGISKYAISIDSADSKVHNKIRQQDTLWEHAINSINYIDKYRKQFKKNIRIVLYSIVNNKNYKKISDIIQLREIANFDEINLIPIKDKLNSKLFLSEEQLKEYYFKIVPKLLKLYNKYSFKGIIRTINYTFADLKNIKYSTKGKYSKIIYMKMPCYVSQFYIYITQEGNVLPCCVAPHHMIKRYIMGNLYKNSLTVIWNSKKYNKLRKELINPKLPICESCSLTLVDFNKCIYNQLK